MKKCLKKMKLRIQIWYTRRRLNRLIAKCTTSLTDEKILASSQKCDAYLNQWMRLSN